MKKKYPVYITRYNFDQDKLNEVLLGNKIQENIDTSGNQIIKTDSVEIENCLMSLKQVKTEYSDDKIEKDYDTNFSEFSDLINNNENTGVMIEDDISEIDSAHKKQESILSNQLDELTKVLELETQKNIKFQEDSEQNYKATKNLIIQMRIDNGEGVSVDDFSDAFPFLPKNQSSGNDFNPAPFVANPE